MKIVENLSALALRQLVDGTAPAAAETGAALVRGQFTAHPEKLRQALARAIDQGWKAFEVGLAGKAWWEICRPRLHPGEETTLGAKLPVFLDAMVLGEFSVPNPDLRRQALRELRSARHGGLLIGELDRSAELNWLDAAFAPGTPGIEAEWRLVEQIADELRQAFPALSELLHLRREGSSPLVAAVRLYFRRAVAQEPELAQGFAALPPLSPAERAAADALADVLAGHAARLDELLALASGEDAEHALDIEAETAGAPEPIPSVGKAILAALRRYQISRQLRPMDFTALTEPERQRVKELANRAHALALEGQQRWPALLHGLGALQAAAGLLDAAQKDFQAALAATTDAHAQALICHSAYRVALEQQNLPAALPFLQRAITLDPKRLAPFPAEKFEPERILGTAPSGVAFLCKHKASGTRVVVKTLAPEALMAEVSELFRATRLLEELDHPAMVHLRDCDYADEAKQRPYLVTDFLDAPTLADHVRQNGPLPPAEWQKIARILAELLAAAHERGVLHRDLKPTTVLLRKEGANWKVKVINFGLACRPVLLFLTLAGPPAWAKTTLGSSTLALLPYQAPEHLHMLEGAAPGPHSDVYSFGRLCYFALLGTPEPDDEQKDMLPPAWKKLLGQCTARNLARRIPNFPTLLKRLTQLPAETAPAAPEVKADPEMIQNLINRGMVFKQQGNIDRALAAFTRALQLDPRQIAGYFKRGNTYLDAGDFDHAIADYTQAIRIDPANAAAHMNRGLAHFKKGDFESVIADCSEAVKIDPKLAHAYSIRAAAFWERGERHRAIADYNLALRADPKNALAYNGRGLAMAEEGNLDQAIADYTQALRLEPRLLVGYLNRGNAYRLKNAPDEALADLTKALRIDPRNATAYFYRGLALMTKGAYDQAISDLNKVLQLDPKHPEAADRREEALRLKAAKPAATPPAAPVPKPTAAPAKAPTGAKPPAEPTRRRPPGPGGPGAPTAAPPAPPKPVAAKNPSLQAEEERRQMRVAAYFTSGKAAYEQEDYPQAVEQFTKGLQVDPQDPQLFYYRGLAHIAQDDFHEALADFGQAIRLNPKNAMAHYHRGLAHRLLGQHDQAIEDYTRALKLDPRLALAYRNRSLAYAAKGDNEKAKADYERALRLDPSLAREE
jgi:tetratricopeptide (TPR) repeat protein